MSNLKRVVALSGLFLSLSAAAASGYALSTEGVYAGVLGGLNYAHDLNESLPSDDSFFQEFKSGYNIGAFIGTHIKPNVRVEAELAYLKNSSRKLSTDAGVIDDNGRITVMPIMFNAIYDFKPMKGITPYAGLGLGAARVSQDIILNAGGISLRGHDNVLAAQAIFGAQVALNEKVNLGLDYRYLYTDRATFRVNTPSSSANSTGHYKSSTINAVLRYKF